jgi:hypothetical protein
MHELTRNWRCTRVSCFWCARLVELDVQLSLQRAIAIAKKLIKKQEFIRDLLAQKMHRSRIKTLHSREMAVYKVKTAIQDFFIGDLSVR